METIDYRAQIENLPAPFQTLAREKMDDVPEDGLRTLKAMLATKRPRTVEELKALGGSQASAIIDAAFAAVTADSATVTGFLQYAALVAERSSEEEWTSFVRSGEIPPIKLSAQELELVKGGDGGGGVLAVVIIGAGVLSCCLSKGCCQVVADVIWG